MTLRKAGSCRQGWCGRDKQASEGQPVQRQPPWGTADIHLAVWLRKRGHSPTG